MLINKLVDNLETPDLIKHKQLPIPHNMKTAEQKFDDLKTEKESTPKDSNKNGIFATLYARQATAATSISETQLPMPMEQAEPVSKVTQMAAPAPVTLQAPMPAQPQL